MKKIVLIGDSIRLGYETYVKEALAGVAEVFSPKENCRFAEYILRYLLVWKEDWGVGEEIDLVHWNVGLWDVAHLYGEDTLTTPDYYEEALKRIVRQLRRFFPNAKLVFATSTAVIESGYGKNFCRYNQDIERFNEIAVRTLLPLGVEINDLCAITKDMPESYHSDMTHFNTKEATKQIGDQILQLICKDLDISAEEIQIEDFVLPQIPNHILGALFE